MQRTLKQTRRTLKQSRKLGTSAEPPSVQRWMTLAQLLRRYTDKNQAGDSSKLGESTRRSE